MTEREYIESIRQDYSGLRDRPRESLAGSVETLAHELYTKDTHFVFELIQNAEDNDYSPEIPPSLSFAVRQQGIEGEAGLVLIVRNNETGFEEKHVDALCAVRKSTKKKIQGYIGEKGIGFKSVFRITNCPYVFSNRFQFCLPEHDEQTGLGYIVPRWVADPPAWIVAGGTTIVLPINKDERGVRAVVGALRDIAPETLLFLNKLNSIEISIRLPKERYEVTVEKHIQAVMGESKLVELTSHQRREGNEQSIETSLYWLTEIEFPKPEDVQHKERAGIESRAVSVAIPLGPDSQKGKLFAYLPVWEQTGLPFLVNADFLLVSSREGIQEDEPWNKWLRDCVVETYVRAFLALLDSPVLPVETKNSAYGSIPLESSEQFLKPIVQPIQARLAKQECVLTLPDMARVEPFRARLCGQRFRALLESGERLPAYLAGEARLISPEIEPFSRQLEAIGAKRLSRPEVLSCLQDTAWVREHPLEWFFDLFRYLSTDKFENKALRSLAIVPTEPGAGEQLRLSCDSEQPIYFSCREADRHALAPAPRWLSKLVPIAFLDPGLLSMLDQQEDQKALRKWLTEALNVYEFSVENYCFDILSKLAGSHQDIDDEKLVWATTFLVEHGGSNFPWESLPVLFSNGQRMSLQDARKQRIQDIVVPQNFDMEAGWQHIWRTSQDREHFLSLDDRYRSLPVDWFEKLNIRRYPSFRRFTYDASSREDWMGRETPVWKLLLECKRSAASSRSWDTSVSSSAAPSSLEWVRDKSQLKALSRSLVSFLKTLDAPSERYYWTYRDEMHRLGFFAKGTFQYRGENTRYCDSEVLERLRALPWLPSSKGLVAPSRAFFPEPGSREVLGDTVPYGEVNLLPENVLRLLGVRFDLTVDELLAVLRENSGSSEIHPDLPARIYSELEARTRYSSQDIRGCFSTEALILVKGSQQTPGWYKSSECVWEDSSAVLGDDFAYLGSQYPELKDFFVEQLGVKLRADVECFAERWLKLQASPLADVQLRRALVERIYREIKPVAQLPEADRPPWWSGFSKNAKVYTESDAFKPPADVVLPDDGELRDIFQGDTVEFAWRPRNDAFAEWAFFFTAFETPLLSESVTEHLGQGITVDILESKRFVTNAAVKMIAAWLREKRKDDYERLLKQDAFSHLASLREATTSNEIKVEFRPAVTAIAESRTVAYPLYWEHIDHNTLIYGAEPRKSQVAKVIARGLIASHAYKDLAHWIELVLGAADTERLRDENWSVPQPILDLFSDGESVASEPGPVAPNGTTAPQSRSEPAPPPVHEPAEAGELQESALGGSSATAKTPKAGRLSEGESRRRIRRKWRPGSESGDAGPLDNKPDKGQDVEHFRYDRELAKAFNRDGLTQFDSDEVAQWEYHESNGIIRHLHRRGEKLAEAYSENIASEPSPQDRRRETERSLLEGPNEAVRVSLFEWYRGRCQICVETWPKRDGEPYFAAAYLVERHHARWLDEPANAISLCAKHFAQWCHAAITVSTDVVEQIRSLRLRAEGGNGDLCIRFAMCAENHAIRYDERHLLALRKLVEVADLIEADEDAEPGEDDA
jgi:hypothetical protein